MSVVVGLTTQVRSKYHKDPYKRPRTAPPYPLKMPSHRTLTVPMPPDSPTPPLENTDAPGCPDYADVASDHTPGTAQARELLEVAGWKASVLWVPASRLTLGEALHR